MWNYCQQGLRRRKPLGSRSSAWSRRPGHAQGPDELTRSIVLERDGHRCVVCGAEGPLDLHHRRPVGSGGSRDERTHCPSNLISVCRSSHDMVHNYPALARDLGYTVRRGVDPARVDVLVPGRGRVLLTTDGTIVEARNAEPDDVVAVARSGRPWPWTDICIIWERDRDLAALKAGLLMAATADTRHGLPDTPGTAEYAAVQILLYTNSHGGSTYWLNQPDFVEEFITVGDQPEPQAGTRPARVHWHAALTALEDGDLEGPTWAERALRQAAYTALGTPARPQDRPPLGYIP